jgi:nicotinamidase-related amidase
MSKKQNTVFVVIESWNRKCDSDGSPQVTLFANRTAARERLKELVIRDRKDGIHSSYDPDDTNDDWEITSEDDLFHAWSESASSWIMFEIIEKVIHETV